MTSFGSVLRSLDWSYLTDLLIQLIPALLCIMIHEICHGAAAYALFFGGTAAAVFFGLLTALLFKPKDKNK